MTFRASTSEVAERSDIALAGPRIDTIPGAQAVP